MPSAWTGDADRDLLLAIIEDGSTKSINWPNVATSIQGKGYSFSHEACRQHFQKIRRHAVNPPSNVGSTVGPANSGFNSLNSSPGVKRKMATPRKPAAPKNNRYDARTPSPRLPENMDDIDSDDPEELPPRPTHKRQRVVKNEDTGFRRLDDERSYQFKTEQLGGPEHPEHGSISHERDESLYDDDI